MQHATWTFQRGDDHLVLQRDDDAVGHALVIISETGVRHIPFRDVAALGVFQSDMEEFLVHTGWSLASFTPDRRRYRDRRLFPRIHRDRRRWWTDGATHRGSGPRTDSDTNEAHPVDWRKPQHD